MSGGKDFGIAARYSSLLAAAPQFSYLCICLLQLKIIWRIWEFQELTTGDTSYYFLAATDWHRRSQVPFAWSPLYTSFLGTFLRFTDNAFAAVTAHRVVIVMALSLLVLALMRRLLPPTIAWGAATWWVVMPINFHALYEVHLFALIPVIVALLFLAPRPNPWAKGAALGGLLTASLVMRNELFLATGLLAVCFAGAGFRRGRPRRVFAPYTVSIAIALAISGFYLWRASDLADLKTGFASKQRLNVCQTYAFGYQQRHSDFTLSPWTQCTELMSRIYSDPGPSMLDALRRNPRAMLEHFLWNIWLTPYGLQVLLFNVSAGGPTPDYTDVIRAGPIVWVASVTLLALLVAGVRQIAKDWRFWVDTWLSDRAWAWIGLGCLSVMVAIVVVTQRPRPSYMFILGIALRALTGMCLFVLISRTTLFERLNRWFPVLALACIVAVPPVYPLALAGRPRIFHDQYERLAPFHKRIESPETTLAGPGLFQETCNYLVRPINCYPLENGATLDEVLQIPRVNMIYVESVAKANALRTRGWQELAGSKEPGASWSLMVPAGR
jgi:hypothetical protein